MSHQDLAAAGRLAADLASAIGAGHVLTGRRERECLSQDIAGAGAVAAVVAQPGSVAELSQVVAMATAAGFAVVPRGGGSSYTFGFVPADPQAVLVDTRRLDAVVDVDADNMRVTVEAGCTWQKLLEALEPRGLRTPFWGPLSGAVATVGGSLSQHAILWGSARYGVSAESVVGLDVVLADGTVMRTGGGGVNREAPFFRYYGPDLAGLFLGDAGALGVKARATLKLVRLPAHTGVASFAFDTHVMACVAMADVARAGVASECFGMDPVLSRQRLKRASIAQGLTALRGVVASADGVAAALRDVARVALAGRGFLDEVNYSVHVGTESGDAASVEFALADVRRIVAERGGRELPDSVPRLMRAMRYVTMTSAIGPAGERWLPVHAVVPLSDAAETWTAVKALLASRASEFERHGVEVGVLTAIVGSGAFVLEPVFYWPAPRTPYYEGLFDAATAARFEDYPPNPAGEALVFETRAGLIRLLGARGAVHLQIGRTYPYREGMSPPAWDLLRAIKRQVDPRGLMNPGALGLDGTER